jgi:hypothetical protein
LKTHDWNVTSDEPDKKLRIPFCSLDARNVPTISFWSVVKVMFSSLCHNISSELRIGGGGGGGFLISF